MKRNNLLMGVLFCLFSLLTACGGGSDGGKENKTGVSDFDSAMFVLADKDTGQQMELYRIGFDATAAGVNFQSYFKLSASLVAGGDVLQMLVSPNKQYVAYVADARVDGVYELFVAKTDGSGVVRVSGDMPAFASIRNDFDDRDFNEYYFAWSPDSQHLAFIADKETDGVFSLYIVDADGEHLSYVSADAVTSTDESIGNAEWSADSAYLAFYVESFHSVSVKRIYIAKPGSESVYALTEWPDSAYGVTSYQWSPVGHRLAFTADYLTAEKSELFFTEIDDGEWTLPQNLSGDLPGTARVGCKNCVQSRSQQGDVTAIQGRLQGAFQWSPDASSIAYVVSGSELSGLYRIAVDGDGVSEAIPSPMTELPNSYSDELLWSPDGLHLYVHIWVSPVGDPVGYSQGYIINSSDYSVETVGLPLSHGSEWYLEYSAWSSDSRHLILRYDDDSGDSEAGVDGVLLMDTLGAAAWLDMPKTLGYSYLGAAWLSVDELLVYEIEDRGSDNNGRILLNRYTLSTSAIQPLFDIANGYLSAVPSADYRHLSTLRRETGGRTRVDVYDVQQGVTGNASADFVMTYEYGSVGSFDYLKF